MKSTMHPEKTSSPGLKTGDVPSGSYKAAGANVKESRLNAGGSTSPRGKRKGMKKGRH